MAKKSKGKVLAALRNILRVIAAFFRRIWPVLRPIFGILITLILILVVCAFVFVSTLGNYLEQDIYPEAALNLDSFDLDETSYLYYVDGNGRIQTLQQVFATSSSQWASFEDIPEDLVNAAVAIEDKRFYDHQGVDWFTTVKACARMFFGDSSVGGSSITQQLVKNLLLTEDEQADDVTVQRKVIEIFRAAELEKRYDKDTIMEYYLNVIYLGNGCRGVRSAAATYFGKELEMLTTAECASLISITNNPSVYNPYRISSSPDVKSGAQRNRDRQLTVLSEMKKQGKITEAQYNEAVNQEMVFKNGIAEEDMLARCTAENCGYKGVVSTLKAEKDKYYCPECGKEIDINKNASQSVYSWFVDTALEDVCMALAAKDGVEWNTGAVKTLYMDKVRRGGYRIYTTLDMKVQNQVDKIYTDLNEIPKTRSGQQLQSAIAVVDNDTGDIIAMAGGVGEKTDFDAFNRATDSKLQSGSSIKPLTVYTPAFEKGGFSPATVIKDLPFMYTEEGNAWPQNDDSVYDYSQTIYSALVNSVNAAAVSTLDKIGLSYSFDFVTQKYKISSLYRQYVDAAGTIQSDESYAPLALGAQVKGVTVRDMTCAYATFANKGVYRSGRTFTKVYDSEGNLVLDNTQTSETVVTEKTVNYINYCLTNAVASGTGKNAALSNAVVAGKTGSTSKYRDRWFCGYTEEYTAAVWCGYDTPEVIKLVNGGGNVSATLWKKVMEPLHNGTDAKALYTTDNMVPVTVCLDSGMLATEACTQDSRSVSRTQTVYVCEEDAPTKTCNCHVMVDYCVTGGGVANEYCKKMAAAGVGGVKLTQKALVKITQAKIDEMLKAKSHGLSSSYFDEKGVYLVDSEGNDASYKGYNNSLNFGVTAPYAVCTTHTAATAAAHGVY